MIDEGELPVGRELYYEVFTDSFIDTCALEYTSAEVFLQDIPIELSATESCIVDKGELDSFIEDEVAFDTWAEMKEVAIEEWIDRTFDP